MVAINAVYANFEQSIDLPRLLGVPSQTPQAEAVK
jgi:hypothetical protein